MRVGKGLLSEVGITREQALIAWEHQKGLCAICREPRNLVLDHDHETSQARGFLCASCNLLLGAAKDRPAVLREAADYLEREPPIELMRPAKPTWGQIMENAQSVRL